METKFQESVLLGSKDCHGPSHCSVLMHFLLGEIAAGLEVGRGRKPNDKEWPTIALSR